MKLGHDINFIVLHKKANSLFSLIADSVYRTTTIGRSTWNKLIGAQASLQRNCNKEGFNSISNNKAESRVRIGIVSNQQNDCFGSESRIGFGGAGYPVDSNTCGNEAVAIGSADNGDKHIKTMGYILVQ